MPVRYLQNKLGVFVFGRIDFYESTDLFTQYAEGCNLTLQVNVYTSTWHLLRINK